MLLPEFGGASNVWTTSTFFFQVLMLLGYLFVNWSVKFGPKKEPFIQFIIIVPALFFLPLSLPLMENLPTSEPFTRLLLTLFIVVGFPFLVLSTTGPLMQKWYSWTGAPHHNDPYFLYAASNIGSFIGLLAYPFLVEPFFSLQEQRNFWTLGFLLFILLVILTGIKVFKENVKTVPLKKTLEKLSKKKQLWWVFLAFIPASLQLGVTTFLSSNIASFPLLWIIPLSIYLLTMVLAFSNRKKKVSSSQQKTKVWISAIFSFIALGAYLSPSWNTVSQIIIFVLMLVSFSVISFVFHSLLAEDRPNTSFLTKYFVLISFGGALGGFFNSIVSPLLFNSILEIPIILLLSLLIFIKTESKQNQLIFTTVLSFLIFMFLLGDATTLSSSNNYKSGRNFYGSWIVLDTEDQERLLIHGPALYGKQSLLDKRSPQTYFVIPDLPFEEILKNTKEMTVIGLGAGIAAAFDDPEVINFIEIDPDIIKIATNYFSFIEDSPSKINIFEGDGRLNIGKIKNKQDVIILDAFASSSIPTHLLTVEAFQEYSEILSEEGIILVNINNRFFNFEPVIKNNADKLGYTSLIKRTLETEEYEETNWIMLSKNPERLQEFKGKGWSEITTAPVSWTDDYSNLLSIFELN